MPEAYVRAEVASFPLTHLEAFRQAAVELNPRLDGIDRHRTFHLWRACEQMLVEHASGWSLDRIVAVRDHSWFGEPAGTAGRPVPRCVPLHRYLRRLAHDHLRRQTGWTEVCCGSQESTVAALAHYRWLVFALPEDLLLAAVKVEPPPQRVNLDPPLLLRRLVDLGVAEIHQHLGAGMDFPLLWASALASLADPELPAEALQGPGMPFSEGKAMVPWLLRAAVARCALAEFLIRHAAGGLERPASLADLVRRLHSSQGWQPWRLRLLRIALAALLRGDDGLPEPTAVQDLQHDAGLPDFTALQDLYAELHPEAAFFLRGAPRSLDEVWRRCDPIAVRLALTGPNAGERWLVRHGLAYLEERERLSQPDHLFSRIFWQVIRLRVLYYRAVVQRPMTAGLQWFVRFYDRIGKLRRPLWAVGPEASYHVAGAGGGKGIAALEVRTSPESTAVDLAASLRDLVESWRRVLVRVGTSAGGSGREPEFGVVLHFVKRRDPEGAWEGGRPTAFWSGTHAEPHPRDRVRHGRYAEYFTELSSKARAVNELLRALPLTLWLVRGIDVASDEIGVPTWVLAPFYRWVEGEAARAFAKPRSVGAPQLRATAHVGEDFRHLLEGLRRIYECVQYLLPRAGGRLGHATALGVEPRSWAESVGSVLMPAEARLWDLVFEWRLYTSFRVPAEFTAAPPPGRQERLKNLIRSLASDIFKNGHEPQVLAEAHHVLHGFLAPPVAESTSEGSLYDRALRRLDVKRGLFGAKVRTILGHYCQASDVFQRGQRLIDVSIDESDIAALTAVQDALRRGVSARGLVVEVNPSSNLLIGDLLDLRHHPILRLFPPMPGEGPPPVPIAVGSDDPLTFSTCLLREYVLLFEAGRAAGYPEPTVRSWLEAIRQTGMDARFTASWPPTATAMADRLLAALDEFLRNPTRRPSNAG